MDASNEPDKARNTADAALGRNAAGRADPAAHTPHIESPSLVPGQGEPAAAESDPPRDNAASSSVGGTALVIAAESRREQAEPGSVRAKPWRLTKFSSLAASLALAVGVGAIAGAIGTLGLQRTISTEPSGNASALQESIVRLTSEFTALKAGVETSTKRLTERLERAERAQSEPASRLAKISEAVERLEKRTGPIPPATIPAASPVAAPRGPAVADVTGSISDSRPPAAKDLSRLPIVPGWVLRSVYGGTALVESRMGLMEIEVGDPLPGGGHVEAIRREGGRWIVVTSRGLILAR